MVNIKLAIIGSAIMAIGSLFIGWYSVVPEIMKHIEILVLGIIFFIIGVTIFAISFWFVVENR